MADDSNLYQKFGRSIGPGETIFREGDTGDQMFIIQEGRVKVSKNFGEGEHILAVLGKGDFFGEMAIVNNVNRTATVMSVSPVKLLCFDRNGFISMINKNPNIALNIIDKLCRRIQHMNMQTKHLVRKNGKALAALNLLYAFKSEGSEESYLYYDRTVEEMSLNLEIPMKTIKAFLDEFETENIIRIAGNKILFLDLEKLNAITEGCD